MRKSKFGKDLLYLWNGSDCGIRHPDDIDLLETDRTFCLSQNQMKRINAAWQRLTEKVDNLKSAPKWRYEFCHDDGKDLTVYLSKTRYKFHRLMRQLDLGYFNAYPNPFSINTLQETLDGYLLFGVRAGKSDQRGLCLLGSGFLNRDIDVDGNTIPPENLGYVVQRECHEETKYSIEDAFSMNNIKALAIINGSNRDTTMGFHLQLDAEMKHVSLGNDEHSELLFIENTYNNISQILEEGGYKQIPAADHMLGCLEEYVRCKNKGYIRSRYQRR